MYSWDKPNLVIVCYHIVEFDLLIFRRGFRKFKIFQLSDGFTLLSHLSDLEAPICLKFYLFDSNIAKVYCLKVYLFDSNIAKPFFF